MAASGRWAGVVLVCGLACVATRVRADEPVRGSCLAIDAESVVYVADTEGDAVVRVALEHGDERTRVAIGGAPEQVLLLPDGRVAVTRRTAGRVSLLDPTTLAVTADVEVGVEPYGLALSSDGSELYVTDVQRRAFVALDAGDLSTRWVAPLRDEDARGVVVAPDGRRAYVTHARAPRVSVVDLRRHVALFSLALPQTEMGAGRRGTANRAMSAAVSPDGRTLVVPMDAVDPGETTPSLVCAGYGCRLVNAGPPVIGAIARVPLVGSRWRLRRAESEMQHVLDPTDVRWDATADTYWISGNGLSGGAGRANRYTECTVPTPRWVVSHQPLTSQLRVTPRIPWLCTSGAACGDRPAVALPETREVELGRDEDVFTRVGRMMFHTTSTAISRNGAMACQTCHPDGRQDGQTWSGPRGRLQTPVLAGRIALTAPYDWHGGSRSLEISIVQTMRRLGGSGLPDDSLRMLASHVRERLLAIPRASHEGDARETVRRGEELFAELGCARCHDPAQGYQNGASYAMLPAEGHAAPEEMDVPSLRALRLGAPYLHDGRARDLGAVLDGGSMGARAAGLPSADRTALIAFLDTL